MIEQGLVLLIQGSLTSLGVPGGFAIQLPKDQISSDSPMAWTYRCITSEPTYVLEGQDGYTELEIQIDCHGYGAADAFRLATAIGGALRDCPSALSDPDHTVVQGIFQGAGPIDGFSDTNRSYVRTIEYRVIYNQN